MVRVLLLGSGPNAVDARGWGALPFDRVVVINNAWRVRPDWTDLIYPFDFPADRMPDTVGQGQAVVPDTEFIPHQNAYGGVVYGGATMAFTATYWILGALKPSVIAYLGCDMVYAAQGNTHFYGTGQPDPLRDDPTLLSLEAKSARAYWHAQEQGCDLVNLSTAEKSRLIFPRSSVDAIGDSDRLGVDNNQASAAQQRESELGYYFPDGMYWQHNAELNRDEITRLDSMWLATVHHQK